jgi:hypothetical protein
MIGVGSVMCEIDEPAESSPGVVLTEYDDVNELVQQTGTGSRLTTLTMGSIDAGSRITQWHHWAPSSSGARGRDAGQVSPELVRKRFRDGRRRLRFSDSGSHLMISRRRDRGPVVLAHMDDARPQVRIGRRRF